MLKTMTMMMWLGLYVDYGDGHVSGGFFNTDDDDVLALAGLPVPW